MTACRHGWTRGKCEHCDLHKKLVDENKRLHELIQEVIDHDETTGWGQNKLVAALKPNEPEKPTKQPKGKP